MAEAGCEKKWKFPPFPRQILAKKTKNFLLSPPVLSSRWVLDDPVFPPSKKGKKKKKKKSSEGDLPQKRKGEEGKTFLFPVIYGLRWPNGKEKAVEIGGEKRWTILCVKCEGKYVSYSRTLFFRGEGNGRQYIILARQVWPQVKQVSWWCAICALRPGQRRPFLLFRQACSHPFRIKRPITQTKKDTYFC